MQTLSFERISWQNISCAFWLLKTAHRAVEAIQMEVFVLPPLLPVGVSIASQLHNSRWNLHSHEPWQILGLASSKESHCSKKRCWNEIYIDSQWFRSSRQMVPILATNSYDVTMCHSTCPLPEASWSELHTHAGAGWGKRTPMGKRSNLKLCLAAKRSWN